MATTLSKVQQERRAAAPSVGRIVPKERLAPIGKESELCDLFIREYNKVDGWTCYPETAGFDVLVVHQDGRQIGVQAKLSLNMKVVDQILPNFNDDLYGRPGPDHRMVIVSRITDASEGMEKILQRFGVSVLSPRQRWGRDGYEYYFPVDLVANERGCLERLFDWSPAQRCYVPPIVSNLPAGVPSPIRLTAWKESAVKVVALMRSQGFVTVKQIAQHGMGATRWTQPIGSASAWLAKGASRGQWVETEHMPPFDRQHPELYAMAVDALALSQKNELALT
jgi:hypothetical protein